MSKEHIKNRVLRRAAKMWGYNELESENSFDPLISLLLSACSSELEKLDFELENTRSRIMERILEVLFPEDTSSVIPSRTIVQVDAIENNKPISLYNSYSIKHRQQNIYNPTEPIIKNLSFSPTIKSKLTSAKLKYLAYGNQLNIQENFFLQESIEKATTPLPAGQMWIGIDMSDLDSIEDLLLYTDISKEQQDFFYHYFKQGKVFHKNKEYNLKEGYNVVSEKLDLDGIMTENHNEIKAVYNEVNQYFFSNFFTVKGTLIKNEESSEEALFSDFFTDSAINAEEDILWLKFQFSEVVTPDILQNFKIGFNCIPVINVTNTEVFKRIKGVLNLFSIEGEGAFLGLDYIKDDHGNRFDKRDYNNKNNEITAVLRRGGVSRFDQRNALELLHYTLELVKDETAAFSAISNNSNIEEFKQIQQNLASLEQAMKEQNIKISENPYLVISGGANKEIDVNSHISYWYTEAEQANDLKVGSVLKIETTNKTTPTGNAVMLQSSFGGRKKLSSEDRILEYRYTMLSRGRIVTIADIEAFAQKHFKSTILAIEVKKGSKKEIALKSGFTRTIDIYISKNKEISETITETEWDYLCDSFLIQLKNLSANVYPYRIFEKND